MTFASNSGIALQANETGIVPTVAQILPFLPKDKTKLFTLRDTLGWHEGEKVLGKYAFTPTWLGIIALVQALRTLDYNVQIIATLYGGNTLYGLKPAGIPITLAQVTGYADFAGWAVNTFPSQTLFAVSVWNEMNGQTNGGITNVDNQHAALANITNATVKVVRAENPAIKIIVGATGGDNIDGFIINTGKAGLDFTKADFLDTHPYISTAKGVATWARQLAAIRKAGIIIPC